LIIFENISRDASPPPLWGRDRVGGKVPASTATADFAGNFPTPHPNPPPQGGREFLYRLSVERLAYNAKTGIEKKEGWRVAPGWFETVITQGR
jgi:hypothetical protein